MNDKQKINITRDVVYMQQEVSQRFYNLITETIGRGGLSEEDILNFKDSINYILDKRFDFISSKLIDKK